MSCTDACIYMGDYEGGEFFRSTNPRAAKPHRCEECGGVIAVGERHEYATGKTDGEFWAVRSCAPCVEIRDTFACDGAVFTMLWESVHEQMFPEWNEVSAIDCLARLKTDAAVAKMRWEYTKYLRRRHTITLRADGAE